MVSCHSSSFADLTWFRRILTFLFCAFLLWRAGAQDQRDEVRALTDFKNGSFDYSYTEGDIGGFYGYWSTWNEADENPCAWVGIVCSANFTVVELDLSGWTGGPNPTKLQPLARLRDLRHLYMSSSYLVEFPEDIGNLTGLVRLDMSSNYLSNIPASISNCTNLEYIYLEQNYFTGELPSLRGLMNLKVLNLADNLLTGRFPKDILELRNLINVDLSGNMLYGSIPSLSKLTKLLVLSLDDNNFTKFEESWLPPPNLSILLASSNLLGGMIPSSITNLSTLVNLDMSRNQFSSVPFGFSRLFNDPTRDPTSSMKDPFNALQWVDLSQNQLSGNSLLNILPDQIPHLLSPGIRLNLSHNNLTGKIPLDGAKPQKYLSLDLSYNQLSGPIPNFFDNENTSIGSLRLQHNSISGDIVDVLNSSAVNILDLQLQNNLLSGDLSRLAFINCSRNSFSIVDLSSNRLQMSTLETNPDPLRAALECFMSGESVGEFRMAANNLSGIALPRYLDLKGTAGQVLEVLDLSNNHLKGEIFNDTFLHTLSGLQYLNLSNNDLAGPVSKNIFNLPELVIFDVANNTLSGQLPDIPPSSTLNNPSFFQGNSGLCGKPLPPCSQSANWWVLLIRWIKKERIHIIVGGFALLGIGSCVFAIWQWKKYKKRHQQDADLIKMLLERESATLMALRDLKKATNNFAETAQIGEGGFGAVYVGKLSDGRRVAIKRSKREGSEKDKEQFLNEVRILSQINHRHLVKLIGCCMENQSALLVFEFVSNGTLQEHLQGKFVDVCLSWEKRLNIAIQTAEALHYLHSGAAFPIYHRDVKSANILLNENLHAKVADFGISRLVPIEATHVSTIAVQGTMGYIDPEYYTSFQLNDKSDVFSFGVVLLELISAKPAIDFRRGGDETSLVIFAKPHIQSGDLQQLIDGSLLKTYNDSAGNGKESLLNVGRLAMKCLDMQSKARPSMEEVLKELQKYRIELNGQSKDSGSTIENHNVDSQNTHIVSFPEIFTSSSSSLILHIGGRDIEMSQSSCLMA